MRAELPWNVAGIPPEAREAARAAARREGLSVGEWLTRRILRSFSDLSEEADQPPLPGRVSLDSWGLPQSPTSRRDTEEMLARVSRSESESGDAYRRIEEQLRGMTRRLDSSERSQTESNRVLSRTAAEINVAAREQTQAFEQIGQAVEAFDRRLEALEHSRTQDGLRDAVKGLHMGLSRLADQITATANQSASQIAQVAGNIEQVATRLIEVRADSENATRTLDQRLGAVERLTHSGADVIDNAVQRLELRLGFIEKSTSDVIGRGLEKLDQRLGLVEKTTGEQMAPGLQRLEQRVGQVEHATSEIVGAELEKFGQRLGMVEQNAVEAVGAGLNHLEQRLGAAETSVQSGADAIDHALDKLDIHANERADDRAEFESHVGHMQAALARLEDWIGQIDKRGLDPSTGGRLDNIEQALTELVTQLEQTNPMAALEEGLQRLADRVDSLESNHGALMQELQAGLAQPESAYDGSSTFAGPESHGHPTPQFPGADDHGAAEAPPFVEPQTRSAREQHGFSDLGLTPSPEYPQDFEDEPFDDLEPHQETSETGTQENFLSAARRSARAASEKVETERRGRGGFAFTTLPEESESRPHSRFLMTVASCFALIVVLALTAHIVLGRRHVPPQAQASRTVVAKPPTPRAESPALSIARPPAAQSPLPVPPAKLQPQGARLSPPASQSASPATTGAPKPPMTLDRATELANSGNATAAAVLGLRYLDGIGGTRANPVLAAKWLGQAAAKGQAVAQYRYGTLYERGQGVTADAAKAMHWYLAAANQGNRKAMHNLAVAYAEGANGKKDMAEAARWFTRAAELGLSDSQFNLAILYERGDGVPLSMIDAYKWYAIAAARGDSESRQRLSVLQTQLDAADRAAAQRAAASFHVAPLSRSANVPPEMGDLGG